MRTVQILELLRGVRPISPWKSSAYCPAHQDKNQSLSVTEHHVDGRTLAHCHAGCQFADIVAALGLKPRDFFVQRPRKALDGGARSTLTVKQLAEHFHIHPLSLSEKGLRDCCDGVLIPLSWS